MADGTPLNDTCRLCDGPKGWGTFTFYNGRPVHRDCLEGLCRLMPHWVPGDRKRVPATEGDR